MHKHELTQKVLDSLPFTCPWSLSLDSAGESATVEIWGALVDGTRELKELTTRRIYTSEDFVEDMKRCASCREITVNINSRGGDAAFGVAAYNALKALPARITTCVTGIAASAASIIFCAGDKRRVSPGSLLMVHGCSFGFFAVENVNERKCQDFIDYFQNQRKACETINDSITDIYAKCGKDKEHWKGAIANGAELWLSADEAMECGLATEKGGEPAALAYGNQDQGIYCNGRMVACGPSLAEVAGRFGLAAHVPPAPQLEPPHNAGQNTNNNNVVDTMNEETMKLLGLPASASAEDVQAAVTALLQDKDQAAAKVDELERRHESDTEALAAAQANAAQAFVDGLVSQGIIAPKDEEKKKAAMQLFTTCPAQASTMFQGMKPAVALDSAITGGRSEHLDALEDVSLEELIRKEETNA